MKDTLISIKRAPYQSLAIFLILFFTTLLSTIIFIFLSFFYSFLNYIETRPQITVYFQKTASRDQIFKIRDQLTESGKTLSINYISKEQAFKIYQELNKDNPLLLEMVSADILPASLEIYAKKPIFLPEIAEFLKKQPGVDEVVFQKDIVNKLTTATNWLRLISIFFFSFLMIMTIIVLLVIFSFKIAIKKEEIHLLQLIGATKNYIRKPFLIEASFFALLTSTISFITILVIVWLIYPFINSFLLGIKDLSFNLFNLSITIWPINPIFTILVFITSFIFSLIIAITASYLAIEKHLK